MSSLRDGDKLALLQTEFPGDDHVTTLGTIKAYFDDSVVNYGAYGDGVNDDTVAIQAAITAIGDAGGGEVVVPMGSYKLTSTLTLAAKTKLKLHPGAVLIPATDFNVVTMVANSQLVGGVIRTSGVSGFSHAAVYFDGARHFHWFDETLCLVSDVSISGTVSEGYGIHMYADGSGEYVAGVHIRNVNIDNYQDGIRLECINGAGTQFINANHFNNICINDCIYQINIIGGGQGTNYEVSGNYFSNIMTESGASTIMALYCEGHRNYFTPLDIWDWEDSAGYAAETPAIHFNGSTAVYNYVLCNMIGYRAGMVRDDGVWGNVVEGSGTQYQPRIPLGIPLVYSYPSYNGIHSDFMRFADKRFTVAQDAGSAPTAGALANLFDDDPTSHVQWTSASTFPVTVSVDFGTDISYIHAVALQFDSGFTPSSIKIEVYDTDWSELCDVTSNEQAQFIVNVWAHSRYLTVGHTQSKMRVTFGGASSTTIKWFNWMVFGCGSWGELWASRGGDTLYGDMTWNDVLEGPVVVTPDGAHTYRLGVDNAGAVIATLVT